MNVEKIIQVVAGWLIASLIGYSAMSMRSDVKDARFDFKEMAKSMADLTTSVSELNTKMAVVIESNKEHEKKIEDHEGRIRSVEKTSKP